jgi:23S rRNA pseudouridine2605 synthase
VDGEVIRDPATDVDSSNEVEVEGEMLTTESREVHLLNKPKGVVSTASDTHGRPTVVSLISSGKRLYPVGRLDAETTGLILLTNDGELANRLTHPRYEVPKTYRAKLDGPIKREDLERLQHGIELDDGPTAPAKVRRIGAKEFEITIHEGRKRQVRRMAEAIGRRVVNLERIGFGELRLRGLQPGAHRRLTPAEVETLWKNHSP